MANDDSQDGRFTLVDSMGLLADFRRRVEAMVAARHFPVILFEDVDTFRAPPPPRERDPLIDELLRALDEVQPVPPRLIIFGSDGKAHTIG